MATNVRHQMILLWFLLLLQLLPSLAAAYPTHIIALSTPRVVLREIILSNSTGELRVIDSNTRNAIPQGPATDGAGTGAISSPPTLIWVLFCFLFGLPLSIAGIRGWRLTTGTGAGLAFAVCAWAAVINSVNDIGIADLLLVAVVAGFFFIGFVLGLFEWARMGCLMLLALVGGVSIGIRIVLLKDGLLLAGESLYAVNWVIVGICGLGYAAAIVWWQRFIIVVSCASAGTFLIGLAGDILINQNNGLSRGLRFLFDRNSNHLADILTNGYHPRIITQAIIGGSILLIPIFAYLQNRIFKAPFSRLPPPPSDEELAINFPTDFDTASEKQQPKEARAFTFSTIWTGDGKVKANRFSL